MEKTDNFYDVRDRPWEISRIPKVLIIGGNGFIGFNLTKRLRSQGWNVTVVDIKKPEFGESPANKVIIADAASWVMDQYYDIIYQLAADMGGAGFIFTGANDADLMTNSVSINLNILKQVKKIGCGIIFYSSSVCMYSIEAVQVKADESDAYPANPDSNYGWEKIFSERLYQAYSKNYGINIRIARFNNTYGPYSTYKGGREKSPAAICRKVLEDKIEIWGDGKQMREFVFIDDLLDAIEIIITSDVKSPVNIGPDNAISIDGLVRILTDKEIKHIDGPVGLQDRFTSNHLIKSLGWEPKVPIEKGLRVLFNWIKSQYEK